MTSDLLELEAMATHDGEPLLSESGMEAIGILNGSEADRFERRNARIALDEIVTRPEDEDDLIYATALRTVVNAEWSRQLALDQPALLRVADINGRSLVALDRSLQSTGSSQPAVLLERGIKGYRFDANVIIGMTIPGEGLRPTISTVPQVRRYNGGDRYMGELDAVAVPVNTDSIGAFHIDSDTEFLDGTSSIFSMMHEEAPGLQQEMSHAFELIPSPCGTLSPTISYDHYGVSTEATAAIASGRNGYLQLAVGQKSVEKAFQELLEERMAKPGFGEEKSSDNDPVAMFAQLTRFALGEMGLPARPFLIPAPI